MFWVVLGMYESKFVIIIFVEVFNVLLIFFLLYALVNNFWLISLGIYIYIENVLFNFEGLKIFIISLNVVGINVDLVMFVIVCRMKKENLLWS